MGDQPHKLGPDPLNELRSLTLETRRHLHGLFEQLTEGLTILGIQMLVAIYLVSAFPGILRDRSGLVVVAWLLYVGFSIGWVVRSIYAISKVVCGSFTRDELRQGKTYSRYCEGRWFLVTMAGLCSATGGLALVIWLL